jgi:hypothetical protein
MKHRFRGVEYEVFTTGEVDGVCTAPSPDNKPVIVIAAPLDKKRGMEVAIHEALHALNFDKQEANVDRTAKGLASFLWKLGFRYEQR